MALPGVVASVHIWPGAGDKPGVEPGGLELRFGCSDVPGLTRAPAYGELDAAAAHRRPCRCRSHSVARHAHLSFIREAHLLVLGSSFCQRDINREFGLMD